MSEIRKLGKIGTVDIYFDEFIEKNSFFFGWRGNTPQESGMIFLPYESMKEIPEVNNPEEQRVLIKRGNIHFIIGSSEDFEDYKKALALYMKQQEINCFDNNIFNFIQKGI